MTQTFSTGDIVVNTKSGQTYRVLAFQPEATRRLSLVRVELKDGIFVDATIRKFAVVNLASLQHIK